MRCAQGSPSSLSGASIPSTQEWHPPPVPHPFCSHGKGTLGRQIFLKRGNFIIIIIIFCDGSVLFGCKKNGREPQKPPVRQAVLLEAGVEVGRVVSGSRQ